MLVSKVCTLSRSLNVCFELLSLFTLLCYFNFCFILFHLSPSLFPSLCFFLFAVFLFVIVTVLLLLIVHNLFFPLKLAGEWVLNAHAPLRSLARACVCIYLVWCFSKQHFIYDTHKTPKINWTCFSCNVWNWVVSGCLH